MTTENKNAWKTRPPTKEEFDRRAGSIPIYFKEVSRKEYQWCQKCGENGKWVVSHNTATCQDDFKHKKKNGNNHRNGVQANIGEGLIPDTTLCLAEIDCSDIKQRVRSCTKKSSKMFGKRLQHKSTLNNRGVKVNQLKPVDRALPPLNPRPISPVPTTNPAVCTAKCLFYESMGMDVILKCLCIYCFISYQLRKIS